MLAYQWRNIQLVDRAAPTASWTSRTVLVAFTALGAFRIDRPVLPRFFCFMYCFVLRIRLPARPPL